MISDAVLRIDAIVKHQRVEQNYYRGRILFEGQEIRFFEPMASVDKNPLVWMRDYLIHQGIGIAISDTSWKNRILEIAEMFHQPVLDAATDAVGWDEEAQKFVFPHFAIHVGGKVETIDWPLFSDKVPGKQLAEPETMSGQDLSFPSKNSEIESLFWATAASVIANIIAPAVDEVPGGICLEGPGANSVGTAVAQAMGCLPVWVRRAADVDRALDEVHFHGVPAIFNIGRELQRRFRHKLRHPPDDWLNCVVSTDWMTARILALRGGWSVVTGNYRGKVPSDVLETAKMLLPAYLRNLCKRQLWLVEWRDESEMFVERVVRDLARFAQEYHGNSGAVLGALDRLLPDRGGDHPVVVADLLGRLIQEGRLKVASGRDGRGKSTLVEVPEQDAFLLTHEDFAKALPNVLADLPHASYLQSVLSGSGVLVESRDDEYLFHRDWLEKRWKRTKLVESGQVKIHG